jgi:hypothetical protein
MIRQLTTSALLVCIGASFTRAAGDIAPRTIAVKKIWDEAGYQMCTDLIRFQDRFLCSFREGDEHIPGMNGKARVISSIDGEKWESLALLEEKGLDLRDPKLSVMPDGRLMLLMAASTYAGEEAPKKQRKLLGGQTFATFSGDAGKTWTKLQPVIAPNEWLWRITWHKDRAYGIAYPYSPKRDGHELRLYRTDDGVKYDLITKLDPGGAPNEATIRFLPDDTAVMLVRRERDNRHAFIGTGKPPYTDWTWKDCGIELGGPNFIILPDGRMFAGGRRKLIRDKMSNSTILARMSLDKLEPVLDFPGTNDGGYAGLVFHNNTLWMSYYSDPDGGKADIFLAQIDVGAAKKGQ